MIRLTPGQRLLIRGVNWLGDAIMSIPALMRIREAAPGAQITLLTPQKLADLWIRHPAVDRIISIAPRESPWAVARRLRQDVYAAAVALPNSHRAALELWLSGIPARIGVRRPWRSWMFTETIEPLPDVVHMRRRTDTEVHNLVKSPPPPASRKASGPRAHHIHHYLNLASGFGARTEPLPPALPVEPALQALTLSRFELGSRIHRDIPLLALNPGAEYGPAKRWPPQRFIETAVAISRHHRSRWLVIGGPGDAVLAQFIVGEINREISTPQPGTPRPASAVALAGRTTLREIADILAACRLLLSNDTGPMHLAAAVGTPVIGLFGSTSPHLTGPGVPGDPTHELLVGKAPCAPCFRRRCPIDLRCLESITSEQVVAAVVQMLSRAGGGHG